MMLKPVLSTAFSFGRAPSLSCRLTRRCLSRSVQPERPTMAGMVAPLLVLAALVGLWLVFRRKPNLVNEINGQPGQRFGPAHIPKHLTEPAEPQTDVLREADRCEVHSCGARAYVKVFIHADFDVLYCAHHFTEHEPRIRQIAVDVIDERYKLTDAVTR